jgi:hypothetical protein
MMTLNDSAPTPGQGQPHSRTRSTGVGWDDWLGYSVWFANVPYGLVDVGQDLLEDFPAQVSDQALPSTFNEGAPSPI